MKRRRIWPLLFCIALGVAISASTLPSVQTELAIRKLFSADASNRREARQFFQRQRGSGAALRVRLQNDPVAARKIIDRLAQVHSDHIFVDVVSALRSARWWTPHEIPIDIWLRRCRLQLETKSDAAAIDVLAQLRVLALDDRGEDLKHVWHSLIQWPHSSIVREMALMEAAAWWGPQHVHEFIIPAVQDPNARVRQLAWLLCGHLQLSPDTPVNLNEETQEVIQTVLWARSRRQPDDAAHLLNRADVANVDPDVLAWLLSQSEDARAGNRLDELILSGHPSAAFHRAATLGPGVIEPELLARLPEPHAAWLGWIDPIQLIAEHKDVLARWSAWRRRSATSALFSDAVALDGTVWAAVLLAYRTLDRPRAVEMAGRWFSSLDDDQRRAGVALCALLRIHQDENESILNKSLVTDLRRAARLARIINAARPSPPRSTDLTYAWRLLDDADRSDAPTQSILIALLGAGDIVAAQWMLDPVLSRSLRQPGRRMLEYAWLIEMAMPEAHELIGLPCPFSDNVAALQFDILRTGLALSHRSNRFVNRTRTFDLWLASDQSAGP